ncbi:Argonaute [Trachipleistophora hominis]|uniref:Argonaute n=1 Tax=Trachipleistophora hominis TaxID=72359 RepID=L7JUB9_TRAHO|nr:Argonaute [Trachipleistophora hominis]
MATNMQLMQRPKNIQPGNVPLTANLLELKVPSLTLHHYAVLIEPVIARRLNPIVVSAIIQRHAQQFDQISYGYDGNTILVTSKQLQGDIVDVEKVGSTDVTIKFEYKNAHTLDDPTGMQCLEIMLRSYQARTFFVDGRKCVSAGDRSHVTGGIELWNGVTQRVKFFNGRLFLNVDVAFTPFYESMMLTDVLVKMCQRRRDEHVDLRRVDAGKFRALGKFLKSVRLTTVHRKNNPKFKCVDVTDKGACDTLFGDDNVSVAEYFAKQYRPLQHPYLPCVVVKKKDGNIFFPIEVVKILEGQKYTKKLSDFQTADVIRLSARPAAERFNCLENRIRSMHVTSNDVLTNINVQVSDRFYECLGKRLSPPDVLFASGSVQPSRGSWNLRNQKVVRGVAVVRWAVLVLADESVSFVNRQIPNLVKICNDMGVRMANPLEVRKVTLENIEEHIKGKELVMVILQDKSSFVYQEVKRIADLNCSVVTQCVRKQNVEKFRDGSFCGNIALKINTKLGGVNFTVDIAQDELIVFGADVTHPGFGDLSCNSIAAVVSSLDKHFSRYHTSLRMQPKRQDIVEDLKNITVDHLKRFRTCTTKVPRKIIFFRDGIGDSLMQNVYFREIEAIREACATLHEGYKPKLTFVVVQKRHSVRFKGDGRDEIVKDKRRGPTCNPMPGTLIDSVGTEYNDFYMISHFALQGTPCPIKYHVLVDENNIPNFPLYIYNMCHVFTRATKSVSVVPPIYYAHLAAARAKCYVNGDRLDETEERLKDVLYYL